MDSLLSIAVFFNSNLLTTEIVQMIESIILLIIKLALKSESEVGEGSKQCCVYY